MRYYKIYTLIFGSDFDLLGQEEILSVDSIDYHISRTKEPIPYPQAGIKDANYKPHSVACPDFYFLDVKGIVQFLVKPDGLISIYIYPTSEDHDMLPFLYDTILSVALSYKNIFTLKASAVVRKSDGKAQLFCAGNNTGKSTLSTVLLHNGYKFLSDDRVMLEWDDKAGTYTVSCHAPKVELWKNVSRDFILGPYKNAGLIELSHPVRKELKKDYFTVSPSILALENVVCQNAFLITLLAESEPTSYQEVTGLKKVKILMKHLYHHHILEYLGKRKEVYQFLSRLCPQLEMLLINRAENAPFIEFVHLVVEKMGTDMGSLNTETT